MLEQGTSIDVGGVLRRPAAFSKQFWKSNVELFLSFLRCHKEDLEEDFSIPSGRERCF